MNEQRPNRFLFSRWIIYLVLLLVGIFLGQRIAMRPHTLPLNAGRELSKLELIVEQIQESYVDTVNVSQLIEETLPAFMEELDPHSVYISASDMAQANESIEGNFDGIGVTFNMSNDTVIVMSVIAGGPSERVGVIPGDRIITVDDSLVAGRKMEQNNVVKMLRGKRGTKVNLGIERAGETNLVHFTVTRDKIPVKSVDAAFMINATTGFIKISKFSKTTHAEFVEAIETLQTQGLKNLVLDLRDNSGGLLDQSFEVANEFLEQDNLIVYTEGRSRPRHDFKATGRGRCKDVNLAVLIDERTASASEIVAGAIQDNDRGTIVGRRSFGKGLVQEPIMFSDNSGIRLTVARYYTPTGRSIQKPYEKNNKQAYENELYERYKHGEMNTSDSSKFSGEQYKTPKGKIVYGGGGIMPDVFVPLDTMGMNKYYESVSRKSFVYRFALQFTDQHRMELNAIKSLDKLKSYLARYKFDAMFRSYAAEKGVKATEAEWRECRHILDAQLRAYIGRNTPLEESAFYSEIMSIDNALEAALKVF